MAREAARAGGRSRGNDFARETADEVIDDGRRGRVRHGHLPEREIMTGIGPVAVRCRRMRDRVGEGSERIRFSSAMRDREGCR